MKHCETCACMPQLRRKMCVTCGKSYVAFNPRQLDCSPACRWKGWEYRRELAAALYEAQGVRAA